MRETRTEDILTPRSVVTAFASARPLSEALEALEHEPFTRIPIYEGDIDTIVGVVFRPRLFEAEIDGDGDKPWENTTYTGGNHRNAVVAGARAEGSKA